MALPQFRLGLYKATAGRNRFSEEALSGGIMIAALRILVVTILDLYWWVVIVAVIASWLVGFGIINSWHPMTRSFLRALDAMTAPVFNPIRRIIPPLGGLDLSPLIVLLLITFLRNWLTLGTFL